MKKLKQSLLLLMIAAILMSCCTGVAFAAENYVDETPYTMTFQQENPDASYKAGDIVPVEIVLSENPGFNSIQFVLKFNKDLLQYMGPITFSDMFPEGNFSNRDVRLDPTAKAYGMFSTLAGLKDTALVAAGGRMVTVGFKVLDDTADASEYSITTTNTDRFSMGYVNSKTYDCTSYPNMTAVPCVVNIGASSGIDSVTLDKEKLTLPVGSTATLTATVLPEDATNKNVTWASDNTDVATVDETGLVTAVASGTANITATTVDGGKIATCAVTVTAKQEASPVVTFSQEDPDGVYNVGNTFAVNVSITNNPGFNGFNFRLAFDKSTFEIVSTEAVGAATTWPTFRTTPKLKFWGAGGTATTVTEDGVFAKLTFKVLSTESGNFNIGVNTAEGENNSIGLTLSGKKVHGVNFTDSNIVPCTVNVVPGPVVSVESVALDQQTLTLTEGNTATLTATVAPEDATNKNVTWASDNEEVAKVENGVVTAVAAGSANITVTTEDGGYTATCAVTVNAKQPDVPEVKTGYTVSLPTDNTSIAVGGNASVDVTVGVGTDDAETVTTYNAVDMQINYDADKLTFDEKSSTLHEASVTDNNGKLSLKRYGDDLNVGTDKFSLKFTAKDGATGEAAISIERANVGIATAAHQDAPEATILNASHTISIEGYNVTLPENMDEVSGNKTAVPNQTYTFTLNPLANYDYVVTAKVNDVDVPCVWDAATNTYSIDGQYVTGDISITVTRTAKKYTVTLDGTGKGDVTNFSEEATYGEDYTFTVDQKDGFNYTVSATAGDETLTLNSTSNGNEYTYTIPGDKITGDVVVKVDKTPKPTDPPTPVTITVAWDGNALEDVPTKATTSKMGDDFTFTVEKKAGYIYTVTATVGGSDVNVNETEDGTYTIKNVGAELVITVNKTEEAKLTVEVHQYVKQDGKDVYLITTTDSSLAKDKLLAYDGANMFYSAKYKAYCYLVVSELSADEVKADAVTKIAQTDGSATAIVNDGDVNGTGKIDINDAQMAYNMYGSKLYNDFEKATMKMYLEADVTGDKQVDTDDAIAIVAKLNQ